MHTPRHVPYALAQDWMNQIIALGQHTPLALLRLDWNGAAHAYRASADYFSWPYPCFPARLAWGCNADFEGFPFAKALARGESIVSFLCCLPTKHSVLWSTYAFLWSSCTVWTLAALSEWSDRRCSAGIDPAISSPGHTKQWESVMHSKVAHKQNAQVLCYQPCKTTMPDGVTV